MECSGNIQFPLYEEKCFLSSVQEVLCSLDLAVLHEEAIVTSIPTLSFPFRSSHFYRVPLLSSLSFASYPELYHNTKFSSRPTRF